MIDRGLDPIGISPPVEIEVLRHELALPRVVANQSRLPSQIVGHQSSLKLSKR